MNELGIPIKLDRTRTLLLNPLALQLCQYTFCVKLDSTEFLQAELTLELTRDLIWSGCAIEDQGLSWETVCPHVTPENYETFHDAIAKAALRGLGISYQPH